MMIPKSQNFLKRSGEKAINLLEIAVDKGWGSKEWIEQDQDYDPLRNEPRFKVLIKKLNEKYQ